MRELGFLPTQRRFEQTGTQLSDQALYQNMMQQLQSVQDAGLFVIDMSPVPPAPEFPPLDEEADLLAQGSILPECFCLAHAQGHGHQGAPIAGTGTGSLDASPLPDGAELAYSFNIETDGSGRTEEFELTGDAGYYFLTIPELDGVTPFLWFSVDGGETFRGRRLNDFEGFPVELTDDQSLTVYFSSLPADTSLTLELHSFEMPTDLFWHLLGGSNNPDYGYYSRHHGEGFMNDLPTVILYSFNDDPSLANYSYGTTEADFTSISENTRADLRAIMAQLEQDVGIRFIEIDEAATGIEPDIRISAANNTDAITAGGYAFVGGFENFATNMMLIFYQDYSTGDHSWPRSVFTHELGHALGLKHPFSTGGIAGPLDDPDLEPLFENDFFSVMSYTGSTDDTEYFGPFDLQALRYLYGEGSTQTATYTFDEANASFRIDGTDGDDRFGGSDLDDEIYGLDGDDFIYAAGGTNIVYGGNGNDTLSTSGNSSELYGEAGNDTLIFTTNGIYDGGEGDDTFTANWFSSSNTLIGGDGFDTVDMSQAYRTQYIYLSNSSNHSGIELYIGSEYRDYFSGNSDANSFDGGGGDDIFYNVEEQDRITGGEGIDLVYLSGWSEGIVYDATNMSASSENIQSAFGDDIEQVWATSYDDTLIGNAADNRFWGGSGKDILNGGGGNDFLDGGWDADTLTGGSGADIFVVGTFYFTEVITDFAAGEDKLQFEGNSFMSWNDLQSMMTQHEGYVEIAFTDGGFVQLQGVMMDDLSLNDFRIIGADGVGPYVDPGRTTLSEKGGPAGNNAAPDPADTVSAEAAIYEPELVDMFA